MIRADVCCSHGPVRRLSQFVRPVIGRWLQGKECTSC